MTVQFQALGRILVLVLDKELMAQQGVAAGTQFDLEFDGDHLLLHRLPDQSGADPEWSFEAAQGWVAAKYAPAFRVLAR